MACLLDVLKLPLQPCSIFRPPLMNRNSTTSYQLPDLPTLCRQRGYHVRANRFCKQASDASLAWAQAMLPSVHLDVQMLREIKLGLLSATAFPSCDAFQLGIATELWFILYSKAETGRGDANAEALLSLLQPRWKGFTAFMPDRWKEEFDSCLHAFCSFDTASKAPGAFAEGLEQRRTKSGWDLLLLLTEAVNGLHIEKSDIMFEIRDCVAQILTCVWDLLSYRKDQIEGRRTNLISVLMKEHRESLQDAVSKLQAFVESDCAKFAALETQAIPSYAPPAPSSSGWLRSSASRAEMFTQAEIDRHNDIIACIRGYKEFIAGLVSWAFETELFFGVKREDVRTFGWVFLTPDL